MDELLQEMIDPEPPRRDGARRWRLWTTIGVFTLVGVGVTSLTTSAVFTDTDSVAGDLLSGTVVVTLDPTDPTSTLALNAGNVAPGDVVNAPLVVTNSGSLALRYAVSYWSESTTQNPPAGAGDLRNMLSLEILPLGANASCAAVPASTTPLGSVTTLGTVAVSDATAAKLVGDPATGAQGGDRDLSAGTQGGNTETLCVRLAFDKNATNIYQATSAKLHLRIDSEQTVNN